jgi:hypothetical protein
MNDVIDGQLVSAMTQWEGFVAIIATICLHHLLRRQSEPAP